LSADPHLLSHSRIVGALYATGNHRLPSYHLITIIF